MPDKRCEARCTPLTAEESTLPSFILADRVGRSPFPHIRARIAGGPAGAASETFTARRDFYRLGALPSYPFKC